MCVTVLCPHAGDAQMQIFEESKGAAGENEHLEESLAICD